MAEPPNPHDRFFRHAFARPEVAQGFFERYLPTNVTALLDLGTLTLAKESFVDAALEVQQSDLLFRLETRTQRPALLYLLLEQKSYPDPWVGLQLLGYLVQIWDQEKQRLKTPPLPPIVPLVVYHGERRWQIAPAFSTLIEAPESLTRFTPAFDFQLCDIHQDQLDDLQHRAWLAVALQVLKYIRSDELPERLPGILALFRQLFDRRDDALAYLETVLRYLAQAAGQLDEPMLRNALENVLPSDIGENVMPTLAETWVEQGVQKGLRQGVKQGLQQGVQQGSLDYARRTLRRQLVKQFGALPEAIDARIEQADQAALDVWLDQVIGASSLEAVFHRQ